jgi:predicted site-specific integrase-resolvase
MRFGLEYVAAAFSCSSRLIVVVDQLRIKR